MSATTEWTEDTAVPVIEARVAELQAKLSDWARHMAARLNARVYLMGSVLQNPSPRDIDIRIVIEDDEFAARYDMPMEPVSDEEKERELNRNGHARGSKVYFDGRVTQRWVDEVAKFSAPLSVRLTYNVDVKVWPASYYRERVYPEPILLASPSPKWWFYTKHCPDPSLPTLTPVSPEAGAHGPEAVSPQEQP
jgi:hypothetical protein